MKEPGIRAENGGVESENRRTRNKINIGSDRIKELKTVIKTNRCGDKIKILLVRSESN